MVWTDSRAHGRVAYSRAARAQTGALAVYRLAVNTCPLGSPPVDPAWGTAIFNVSHATEAELPLTRT